MSYRIYNNSIIVIILMNEINYQEKFVNFQAITENNDPDVAMRYLQEANWDENVILK
jgi:hypothetical protein